MAEKLKQRILEEIAKIPEVDSNKNYRFYLNLSELIGRYAHGLRELYNEERIADLERSVLDIFRSAKTLDYNTGKLIPLDYENECFDLDTVEDAVSVDTYHDGEEVADLRAFKIKDGKLFFNAVSYHSEGWVRLDSWNTRKSYEITRETLSTAREYLEYTRIPEEAFYGRELMRIIIPDGVTRIGRSAFAGCFKLKEIHLPESLCEIDAGAFWGCRALTDVHIPEGVNVIGNSAFFGCTKLSTINIPAGVTRLGDGVFSGCHSLSNIDLPYGVTEIGNSAFYDCPTLVELIIPGGVTKIGKEAFRGCSTLTEIHIPEGVTEIGDGAFRDCYRLSRIHIPVSLARIGADVFKDCPGINEITVSPGNAAFDSRQQCNALVDSATGTLLQGSNKAFIPESVTKIGDRAFFGFKGLVEIHIPNSVTEIGERAFFGCSKLTKVRMSDNVRYIGEEAFKGCAFIPEWVTEIPEGWFSGVTDMKQISIPAGIIRIAPQDLPAGVKEISVSPRNKSFDSRNNCNGIVETASNALVVGCENTVIPDSVTEIGEAAFRGCAGLREMSIPKGITRIGTSAFGDCIGLRRVFIPDTVLEVGESAFSGCRELESLLAPEGLDLKAAKVPRRKDRKIVTRYSPKKQDFSSNKAFALTTPSGTSIPVECEENLDGRIVITNWPSIQDAASGIDKAEIEAAMEGYHQDDVPFFILAVLDVLKGGFDKIPFILFGLDSIHDSILRDKLESLLRPVLEQLTERERFVAEHFFGIGIPGMTLSAIAESLNLTVERTRQIKEKAIFKIRTYCPYAADPEGLKRMKEGRAARIESKMNETHEERERRIEARRARWAERETDDKTKQ